MAKVYANLTTAYVKIMNIVNGGAGYGVTFNQASKLVFTTGHTYGPIDG